MLEALLLLLTALSAFIALLIFPGYTIAHAASGQNDQTLFLLEVDQTENRLVDRRGGFQPVVNGGEVVSDLRFGKCLKFGDSIGNGITVEDGGKISFNGGFTLEARLYLEEGSSINQGGLLALKMGSFAFAIKDYKLNNSWMSFPTENVATTSFMQYKYYPVGGEAFYGAMSIPANQWVHVAVTYDQDMKVIRSWIDGGLDRTRYLARTEPAPLLTEPARPLEFLRDMRNVCVAEIRLSRGVRPMGSVPPMEAYVHQLPYEGKIAIVVDHIDRKLKLPLDIAILLEAPNGASKVVKRVALDSYERKIIDIEAPKWKGALHTLSVKSYAGNEMIFSKTVRISNVTPSGKVGINPDKSISVNRRKLFPLMIYHAFPEDYEELAGMGFNIIAPRGPSLGFMGIGGTNEKTMADIKTCLDEALKQKVYLMIEGNTVFGNLNRVPLFKDHPALLAWSGFDEPWGSLEKVQESYNVVKLLAPDGPVYCTQNNETRFAETAEGADILACDPYPLPNVSLRHVADATKAAVRAVAGLKPVWTILDQYGDKRPSIEELRSMAYLAVISGANGLGIYAWDDRLDKKSGWYTKEHPQDVEVLRTVMRELKSLEPILLIPNSGKRAVFSPRNNALHASIKEAEGKTYLFIASDSRRKTEGELTVEGMTDSTGNCLFDECSQKNIRLRRGAVFIKLPPLGVAVYEITHDR